MYKSSIFSALLLGCMYSGLLKWIPLPVDLTILSGSLLIFAGAYCWSTGQGFDRDLGDIVFLLGVIVIIVFLSCLVTISSVYWVRKALGFTLSMACFVFPIVARDQIFENSRGLWRALNALGLIMIALVAYEWRDNGLNVMIYQRGPERDLLPVYLTLSEFMGVLIIANLSFQNVFNIGVVLGAAASLGLLGGRGAAIGLLIALFILLFYGKMKKSEMRRLMGLVVSTCILLYMATTGFAERLLGRFRALGTDNETLLGDRVFQWQEAWAVIIENPIFGVGFAGYGVAVSGLDAREYPHNIFLEIAAEMGILAAFVFAIFFFRVFIRMAKGLRFELGPILLAISLYMMLQFQKSSALEDSRMLFGWLGLGVAYYVRCEKARIRSAGPPRISSGRRG